VHCSFTVVFCNGNYVFERAARKRAPLYNTTVTYDSLHVLQIAQNVLSPCDSPRVYQLSKMFFPHVIVLVCSKRPDCSPPHDSPLNVAICCMLYPATVWKKELAALIPVCSCKYHLMTPSPSHNIAN
jgi:hypothetical protein